MTTAPRKKPGEPLPFDPYPNYDTYTVVLLLENEAAAHARLVEAARAANFMMGPEQARKAAGRLESYPAYPEDPALAVDASTVDWALIASDWNERAREFAQHNAETALSGSLGRIMPVLHSLVIDEPVGALGDESVDETTKVRITGRLERKTYTEVDDLLRALGGRWDRKQKAHIFAQSPSMALAEIIATGKFVKPYHLGYFPTPGALADEAVSLARIEPGMRVLEPSIGEGHIAEAIRRACPGAEIGAYEIDPKRAAKTGVAFGVVTADFMQVEPKAIYDRVVMNPPFERGQDVDHVAHAWSFLKPGGRLVAIMGAGVEFRDDTRYRTFREAVVALGGSIARNPAGSFTASGTAVNSVMVAFDKVPGAELRVARNAAELKALAKAQQASDAVASAPRAGQRRLKSAQPA